MLPSGAARGWCSVLKLPVGSDIIGEKHGTAPVGHP
jgi:hypothetical protein